MLNSALNSDQKSCYSFGSERLTEEGLLTQFRAITAKQQCRTLRIYIYTTIVDVRAGYCDKFGDSILLHMVLIRLDFDSVQYQLVINIASKILVLQTCQSRQPKTNVPEDSVNINYLLVIYLTLQFQGQSLEQPNLKLVPCSGGKCVGDKSLIPPFQESEPSTSPGCQVLKVKTFKGTVSKVFVIKYPYFMQLCANIITKVPNDLEIELHIVPLNTNVHVMTQVLIGVNK